MSDGTQTASRKREIISFEPTRPVAEMLRKKLKGKRRGSQTRLIEDAIVGHIGAGYPKLAARFAVLRDEQGKRKGGA